MLAVNTCRTVSLHLRWDAIRLRITDAEIGCICLTWPSTIAKRSLPGGCSAAFSTRAASQQRAGFLELEKQLRPGYSMELR